MTKPAELSSSPATSKRPTTRRHVQHPSDTSRGEAISAPTRRIEVSGVIDAPADAIFSFLTRADNHVALDTTGMIRSSADHCTLTEVGVVFVMNMRNHMRGGYQVENHVICYEPARAIGWAPAEPGKEPAGHTWTWRMTRIGPEQTLVTEIYDWSAFRFTDVRYYVPFISRRQMRESVARLAEAMRCSIESG